jgi:hypothetical protein
VKRLRLLVAALTLAVFAPAALADEVLVLKDGRRIAVTRLIRKGGKVVFQTTKGEVFAVPEEDVVSPPLLQIPVETLVLKDGRRIPVLRLGRRGAQVVFQTLKGEGFAVPEDQVVEPPLESIPRVDAPPAAAPTPVPEAAVEAPPAAEPPAVETPAAPVPPETAPILDGEFVPLSDRWEIDFPPDPRFAKGRLLDPYNQNVLKGDKPVAGESLFLVLGGVLDAPLEGKRTPVASGVSASDAGSSEFFGRGGSLFTSPRAALSVELFHGQTAFKPKDWALKATGVFNLNYVRFQENNNVNADVREGRSRQRHDFALEEAFGEVKLLTLSRHYDFVSLRAGIQPFLSDFRGFVFSDVNLGARLFGNAADNTWQYNAAYFDLLEKETNSELNTFERREQKVIVANVFRQDFLTKGYTLSLSYHRSQDEAGEKQHYDANGFLVRPAKIGTPRLHELRTNYLGLAGDGHWGRLNVSEAFYYVFGEDEDHPLANGPQDIRAFMAAAELSVDRDWARFKLAGFFASGDDDPFDERATGFDSIYDAPNFAGGVFSFWNRTPIALTQTGVLLKGPFSLLPDLRSNKFEGQANHVNPGILIANAGLDAELTPKLKAVLTASYLRFHETGSLEQLLFQPEIRNTIGFDVGGGVVYRPLLNENVVISAGLSGLLPGGGWDDIFSSPCAGVSGCGASGRDLLNGFVQIKLAY